MIAIAAKLRAAAGSQGPGHSGRQPGPATWLAAREHAPAHECGNQHQEGRQGEANSVDQHPAGNPVPNEY